MCVRVVSNTRNSSSFSQLVLMRLWSNLDRRIARVIDKQSEITVFDE